MSAIRRNGMWLVAVLVVAAAVHVASVALLPHVIMNRTMGAIAHRTGVNKMAHTPRPTAAARGIVRPSPDLLYSTCVFDVSGGPVRVHANGMPSTYWSVSLFDDRTDNFYVINDRQAKSGGVDFLIAAPGTRADRAQLPIVVAPSNRGLVLVRTLIDDDKRLAEIEAARRHAACEPFK